MSDSRREVVARTLYRFVEGTMTDNRMPWPILCDLYPGTAEHYRAMADETLTAIDATPGPATVSEAELTDALIAFDEAWPGGELTERVTNGYDEPDEYDYTDAFRDAMTTALETFLAARTTARAEPTEDELLLAWLDGEITAAQNDLRFHYGGSGADAAYAGLKAFKKVRDRVLAARNAGQGVTE